MSGIGQFGGGIMPAGGGSEKFPDGTLLTRDFGLLLAGSDIGGLSPKEVIQQAYAGFVDPVFTSFSFNQSNVEVGTTLSGNRNFTWAFDLPDNVADNSLDILDVTAGQTLAAGLPKSSPGVADIGNIQKVVAASHQWRAQALDTQGKALLSAVRTISWQYKRFWGFSDSPSPDDNIIKAGNQELSTSRSKSWNTGSPAGSEHFFYAYPATFGALSSLTLNGFPSLPAFTETIRNFVNAQGVTVSYRIYVSNNLLSSAAPIVTA